MTVRIDSVFVLFTSYPGDPILQAYIREAISSGILPLSVYVATFLQAARARLDAATLDGLCKTAIHAHGRTNPLLSLLDGADAVLATIQDAIFVLQTALQTAYAVPTAPLRRLIESSSELVAYLVNSFTSAVNITNASNITSDASIACAEDAKALLLGFPDFLSPGVQHALQNLVATLNLFTNDESTLFRPIQLAQWSAGKDVLQPGEDSDTVTCALLLSHMAGSFICLCASICDGDLGSQQGQRLWCGERQPRRRFDNICLSFDYVAHP
jgi:mediator of RNA polymerase II transcription subunit 5